MKFHVHLLTKAFDFVPGKYLCAMLRATILGGHKIDVLLSQKTIGFSCCWAGRIPSCRSVRLRLCQGRSGGKSCNSRVILCSQFMVSEAGTIVEHELNRPCSN